jgi:type II restriction enzyme
LITAVATNLKYFTKTSLARDDKLNLLKKLQELDYYKERNPELPLDSINHRINTLAYYMFGYKDEVDGESRFLFSPLGNLFLKNIDNFERRRKIFLTMLWAIQYEHPHGGTDKSFKLYPFRLIFKLLNDERLDEKLQAYEVAYLVVFTKTINPGTYEKLVQKILEIRKWTNEDVERNFKKDEHTYVNAVYEWDYYVSTLFESAGVLQKAKGDTICTLLHGKNTKRKLTKNIVTIPEELSSYCKSLLESFPYDEKPLQLDDPERLRIDVIKEIYSFLPKNLLEEIGEEKSEFKYELLNLTKYIEQYSNNNNGKEAYLFEDILTEGFNLFFNIEAKKIGGAGNTDIECLYLTRKKKFAVDAKSTKNKLAALNAGRLAAHRSKIGGEYTIVVTPRYVPAVLHDIKKSPIVILRASTFSEYLYNHIDNGVREIDYADFDEIITKNMGADISKKVSTLTINKFSIKN